MNMLCYIVYHIEHSNSKYVTLKRLIPYKMRLKVLPQEGDFTVNNFCYQTNCQSDFSALKTLVLCCVLVFVVRRAIQINGGLVPYQFTK